MFLVTENGAYLCIHSRVQCIGCVLIAVPLQPNMTAHMWLVRHFLNLPIAAHTCKSTFLLQSPQVAEISTFKQKSPLAKVSRGHKNYWSKRLMLLHFRHVKLCFSSGPPVEFVDPPEQVEVRVGEQARLHCEFRSSSVPVACCWICNKDKVIKMFDCLIYYFILSLLHQ